MMNEKESIHVTMHVLSRKSAKELQNDQSIQKKVDAAFNELMHPIESGGEVAKRLALPADVPIKWDVKVAALNEGFSSLEGHIPVMVSVAGVPAIMEKLQPDVVEEVTNVLFKEIRKDGQQSKSLAQTLGYETEKPTKFHLYLPHQVKMRGPADPALHGDGDDGDGWGKGCSSWPW
jgi:hypothetical protein